ncbi:MAG: TetR/AcrR family transcriptional regulator C-terminal domain-containing protein [Clostridia bacterium]|nr:TetR/AcrR family transcriptional regulator C-terminal domain-containing protein [Clostridia bacterium]
MQDLRIRRTYKLLTESLLKLMKKKPFEKITVKDICEDALVHRTTFYTHFQDKYDLLHYCMSEFTKSFDTNDLTTNSFDGYRSYCITVAEGVLSEIERNSELFISLLRKNKEESVVTNFQDTLAQKISEKLLKCQESGMELSQPIPLISNFFAGACMSSVAWWLENGMPISSDALIGYLEIMITEKSFG